MMDEAKEKEIENAIAENAAIEEARVEVEKEINEEETKELEESKGFWKSIRNLFCRTVKTIVTIACRFIKSEILFILNNEENQKLAKVAVMTAIKLGLKSNAAWAAAWAVITAGEIVIRPGVKVKATDVRKNILETLLQLVYCCIANKDSKTVVTSCIQQ